MSFKSIIETYTVRFKNIKSKYPQAQEVSINSIDTNYFQDLTPSIIEGDNTYSDAIKWALDNENIKNIALNGSYGTGKSTNHYSSFSLGLNLDFALLNTIFPLSMPSRSFFCSSWGRL